MDRDQLIDLTRRARKLARDKTTDLAPSEYSVRADSYTSAERLAGDTAMLIASPQLVGYSSELSRAGTYCTAGAAAVFDYAHARPRWLAAQLFQAWAGHGAVAQMHLTLATAREFPWVERRQGLFGEVLVRRARRASCPN